MSELERKLAAVRGFLVEQNLNVYACAIDEAIAALRSEPVAWSHEKWEEIAHKILRGEIDIAILNDKLYAAPSRETAKPEAEPALSAEQIKKFQWNYNKHDGMGNPDGWVNTLCNMALSYLTARDEWKNAIIDELVVCHAYHAEHKNNPRKALKDAIHWNIQVALDPAVSKDAQKLKDEGIEAAAKLADENGALQIRWFAEDIRKLKGTKP